MHFSANPQHLRFSSQLTRGSLFTTLAARLPEEEESSEWLVDTVLGRTRYEAILKSVDDQLAFSTFNANQTVELQDVLHGDINYFTDNPALGPQRSHLRGHFGLEGAKFEAKLGKHGDPKLVIHRKSGIPYVPIKCFIPMKQEIER